MSWPEAVVACVGNLAGGSFVGVLVWCVFKDW